MFCVILDLESGPGFKAAVFLLNFFFVGGDLDDFVFPGFICRYEWRCCSGIWLAIVRSVIGSMYILSFNWGSFAWVYSAFLIALLVTGDRWSGCLKKQSRIDCYWMTGLLGFGSIDAPENSISDCSISFQSFRHTMRDLESLLWGLHEERGSQVRWFRYKFLRYPVSWHGLLQSWGVRRRL